MSLRLASYLTMGGDFFKAGLALVLVTCVVVIVISPLVDLPPTVQNTKTHLTVVDFIQTPLLTVLLIRTLALNSTRSTGHSSLTLDLLELSVVHRC